MWKRTFWLYAVGCAVWARTEERESRIVNITQGPVKGYKDPESGVYFFQSIPYATAPTGPNRFKAPLPPPTWTQPLEAVSSGIICPQATLIYVDIAHLDIREDCLIANVYVPDVEEKNLPVVVYVHGGAFQVGHGDMSLPTKVVAANNVIYVTFNYRLGTHGFLCLGTEDIPGNAGMKDQVAALRWVKNNIASFGGNPDDVTIEGSSAGSASVDLLMLSKSAEGLFNKVIPESGASIAEWTIQSDPLENAKGVARYLNFTDVDDIYKLEDFYKTISYELLTSVPFFYNPNSTFGISPCVERVTDGEVFLDKSPVDIIKSGSYRKVPLLYGFTNMEGLLRLDIFEAWKDQMKENMADFLPGDLIFKSEEEKIKVGNQVKDFYFGDKGNEDIDIITYIEYFTDVIFTYPMLRAVKYHIEAGHDQIYLYEYSFVDESTPLVPHTNIRGATHCAQNMAIWGISNGNNTNSEFLKMSSIIRKIWGNFIKTGRPLSEEVMELPAWPVVNNKDRSPHMLLSNKISLGGSLLNHRALFWDKIYEKYYRTPIPPPKPTTKS